MKGIACQVLFGGAEIGGKRPVGARDFARKHAYTVPRGRIGEAIAEASPVIGLDVRNTVARPADINPVAVIGLGRASKQKGSSKQRQNLAFHSLSRALSVCGSAYRNRPFPSIGLAVPGSSCMIRSPLREPGQY